MATQLKINAKKREKKTPNQIRREGFVPATVYGHDFESLSIQINAKEFSKIPHKAYSHINELTIDGQKFPILIRNVQTDPIRDHFLNVEFYKINESEKLKVRVPLNYLGHSPAIIKGGVLIVAHSEVEIYCLPKDIPDAIDVNLEKIEEIGQSISVKDLKILDTIQIITTGAEVLAKVEIPKTHEVEVAPVATEATTAAAAPAADAQAGAPAKDAPGAAKGQAAKPATAPKAAEKPVKK